MSHLMTALAMSQKGLKPAVKIVLYWLADHHNSETDACFPSLNTLAEECEMTRATVVKHIDTLVSMGFVTRNERFRDNGSRASTSYTLSIKQPVQKLNNPCLKTKQAPVQKLNSHTNLGTKNLGSEPSLFVASDGFDEFWDQYPHRGGAKKGKDAARKSWNRAVRTTAPNNIISGAMKYATDRQVVDGFAKNPATWLNQRGWEDDIEPAPIGLCGGVAGQAVNGGGQRGDSLASIVARRRMQGEV